MKQNRRAWIRGVLVLGLLGMIIAGLVISPVGAVLKKKNVRKIATKVVNQALTDVNADIAALDEVKVAHGGHHSVPSDSFTDVTGATATIDVPAGSNALIVARFSASSICGPNGGCYVRILIGGVEADPVIVSPWDTGVTDASVDYEASAIQRSRTLGAGTHTVQVQARRGSGVTFFDLDNWHLSVERFLV